MAPQKTQDPKSFSLIHIGLASEVYPGAPAMHLYMAYNQRLQPRLGILPRPAPKMTFLEGGVLDAPAPIPKAEKTGGFSTRGLSRPPSSSQLLLPNVPSPPGSPLLTQGSVSIATLQVVGRSTLREWDGDLFGEALRMLHLEAARQMMAPSGGGGGGGELLPSAHLMDDGLGTLTALFGELGDRSGEWVSCGVRARTWAEGVCTAALSLPWWVRAELRISVAE